MFHSHRQSSSRVRRQAGLTLVELMVGVTLGLLLTVALLRMFAEASANGQNVQRVSVQIENGRYAAELLRDDLQLAGYFGEVSVLPTAYSTPDPCSTTPTGFAANPLTLPTAVRGYGAGEALGCLNARRAGTDALVVRRLDVDRVMPGDLPAGNSMFAVQHSFCDNDPFTARMVFGTNKDAFSLRNRACTGRNPVRAYLSRIYFVASCNRCDGEGGDRIPTLKRVDLANTALVETALVEGVETLRLEYGFDTDNDGAPDLFLTAPQPSGAASRWENVVALRLHYVVRSTEAVQGGGLAGAQTFNLGAAGELPFAADGFVRRAYTTTVSLINVGSTRELQ